MSYPTLTVGHVQELVEGLARGATPSADAKAVWRGDGEAVQFDELDAVLDALKAELQIVGADPSLVKDKEPFEGRVALAVFPWLSALPLEVLDDPGFWRYLSISRFWWFIEWREWGSLERGKINTYTDGRRNTEHIPLRLYLRVKCMALPEDRPLAGAIAQSTDFWRSHVIRVRTATAPELATALARMQAGDGRLATTDLRAYARRLNRMWTNVQLGLYDRARSEGIIEELRE